LKAISGKDFAKLLEKKGWELRKVRVAIIFMLRKERLSASLFPFMEINH